MKVIDLIIELQKLPADLDVWVDMTSKNMDMFKFGKAVSVNDIETSLDEHICLISPKNYDVDPTEIEYEEEG
jgi:hypothetical protein